MKCSNCGYENGDEAVFCLNCGEKIGNKSEGTLHGTHPSTPKTGEGGKGSCLRYILALLACAGVYIAWSAMGTFVFGWKHGGGMIPTLILMAIIAGVWKTIVRRKR